MKVMGKPEKPLNKEILEWETYKSNQRNCPGS